MACISRGMDETYVESISISQRPEQFILLETNRENGREELVTELEQALDSGNDSTQTGLNIDSGAGANAGSRADKILVSPNQLSELVWSPRKGLTLKCADCSSTDKKFFNLRPCGDTEDLSRTLKVPLIDVNHIEDDKSANEEMVIFSHVERPMTNSVTILPNKFLIPGTETGLRANSLSYNPEASKRDLARVEHEHGNFNKGKISDHIEESEDVSSGDKVAESISVNEEDKRNKTSLVEASPINSWHRVKQKKYKEKVLLDKEVNHNVSKDADDSHESVECSNSGEVISTGKRERSFERQQEIIGTKKIKKRSHESHFSAASLKQESSFINWVSNIKKGISKINVNKVPSLDVTAEPSHPTHGNSDPVIPSHDKRQDPGCTSMGFQNIFRAMYCQSLRTVDEKNASLGHQRAKGLKELELANGRSHISSEEDNVKLCKLIPISNQIGEFPLILPINASANSEFGSRSEGKGAKQLDSVDSDKYSNSGTNKNAPPGESLWITRFFPNISRPMLNLGHCNQVTCADIERITNCNEYLPHSQTGVSVKDQNNLLYVCEPSFDEQKDSVSRKIQYHSGCSEKKIVHSDQKLKSKLSPILPSQRFKKLEAMASVFARRLDTLKHILLSEVKGNATQAAATCFFCGIRGHTIRDCSELFESELEDILQNINVYDGGEESSCVCIHCFQTTHWAISCPFACSRKKSRPMGNASLADNESCDTLQQNQKYYAVTNGGGRNLRQSEEMDNRSQLVGRHTISPGENSRVGTELIFLANVNDLVLKERVSSSNPIEKDLPRDDFGNEMALKKTSREFIFNEKQNASNSRDNESAENPISPSYSFFNTQITSVPRGIFKMINRLRLSRTDIIKWRKSPIPHFYLEGFFLRLRLGKWEEELGGTGYHVAFISGGIGESSCGSSKNPLIVTVGGLTCLVDCCYISNHDFVEEELMAWWYATLRGDVKLPSEEELNLKLTERKKYGF